MTTILKSVSPSEGSFLLPSTMASRAAALSSRNESVNAAGSASQAPLSNYASVARTAATADDKIGSGIAADLEEQRRAFQVEFEKRIKLAEDEAQARGWEEGLLQGRAQGQKEWLDQVDRAKKILSSLGEQHRDFAAMLEDELVALVFAGIARIVGTASASEASVKEVVRKSIAEDGGRLIARVSPDDFDFLTSALKGTSVDEIEVVPDSRVVLGGCLLESDRGTLDARLETQIEHIRQALLSARAHHPVER